MTERSGNQAAIPVIVSAESPQGLVCRPVIAYTPATLPDGLPIAGDLAAQPVYLVSAAELASGAYALQGDVTALPIVTVTDRTASGAVPLAVYIVGGSIGGVPNAATMSSGIISLDGVPTLLYGFFTAPELGRDGNCLIADLATMATARANFAWLYLPAAEDFDGPANASCGGPAQASIPAEMWQAAADAGIYLAGHYNPVGMADVIALANSEPAAVAWSVGDDVNTETAATVSARYATLSGLLEPGTRLLLASGGWHPNQQATFAGFDGTCDGIILQNYPVGNMQGNGFTTIPAYAIAVWAAGAQSLTSGNTAYLAATQLYKWPEGHNPVVRYPTAAEYRLMCWSALLYGAKGLIPYTYFDNTPAGETIVTAAPALWAEAQAIGDDLFDTAFAAVAINGTRYVGANGRCWREPTSYTFWPQGALGVHAGVWQHGGTGYLVAASTDDTANQSASFAIPAALKTTIDTAGYTELQPLFAGDSRYGQTDMRYNRQQGVIECTVPPLTTQVYHWATPAPYTPSALESAILSDNPSFLWRLDDFIRYAADQIGGNSGVIETGALLRQVNAPWTSINTASGGINIYSAALATVMQGAAGTVELLLRIPSTTPGSLVYAFSVQGASNSDRLIIARNSGASTIRLQRAGNGTSGLVTTAALAADTWHHLVVTWSTAGNLMNGWLNGVQVGANQAAAAWNAGNPVGTGFAQIGQLSPGASRISGNIAMVAVYPTALSSARIAAHAALR